MGGKFHLKTTFNCLDIYIYILFKKPDSACNPVQGRKINLALVRALCSKNSETVNKVTTNVFSILCPFPFSALAFLQGNILHLRFF